MRRVPLLPCAVALAALLCGCSAGDEAGPAPRPQVTARVRRLSVREYVRSVERLVGVTISPYRFLADSLETGYDNGPVSGSVQPEQADSYEFVAWEVADAAVRDHRDRLLGSCDPTVAGAAACEQAFFDGFVVRALRRPPTASERARYQALFEQASAAGGFDEALSATTAAILESPSFLYRTEIGQLGALDPYEVSTQLAFLLTGVPPDDELLEAARTGGLDDSAGMRAQAARLLSTADAREQFRHFLDQWLATWQLDTVQKDGRVYPSFDGPLRDAMRKDLDRFYQYVVFDSPGRSLADLLGSQVGFVDAHLAPLYGVAAPAGDQPVQVDLDPQIRRGILTRAGFLSVHSGVDSSNPIARGVFLLSAVLCAAPQAPPAGIPRVPPGNTMALTTRQRFEEHTADPFCQGCHAAIDGVGFALEEFDGVGAYRTQENGVPIDASGQLVGTRDADGPLVGAGELSRRLRSSQSVRDCFVRQLFRYAMGAPERDQDQPFLQWLSQQFGGTTPMSDLFVRVAADPPQIAAEAGP